MAAELPRTTGASKLVMRIERGFSYASRSIEIVLGLAFVFAVVLNFANATARYGFKRSIIGADEVQIFIMIWMTFVGADVVTWSHQHLRMDVLLTRFSRPVRATLLGVELVLALVLTADDESKTTARSALVVGNARTPFSLGYRARF